MFLFLSIGYSLHICLHLGSQIRLIQLYAHLRVNFYKTQAKLSRYKTYSLLFGIESVLDILDVLVDRGIGTYARARHFGDQITLSQVFRCASRSLT